MPLLFDATGRCVIGLGLHNDLVALGIQPESLGHRLDLSDLAVFRSQPSKERMKSQLKKLQILKPKHRSLVSLRNLANKFLDRKIQGKAGGHSARCASFGWLAGWLPLQIYLHVLQCCALAISTHDCKCGSPRTAYIGGHANGLVR